jgi:hypothetical protein
MASHDESFEKGWGVSPHPEPSGVVHADTTLRRDPGPDRYPAPVVREARPGRPYLPWYEWRRCGGRGVRPAGVDPGGR